MKLEGIPVTAAFAAREDTPRGTKQAHGGFVGTEQRSSFCVLCIYGGGGDYRRRVRDIVYIIYREMFAPPPYML